MTAATLEIVPLERPPGATIRVPGSKSMTNRALVLAALASPHSECSIRGALQSEDTELMITALRRLGFRVHDEWSRCPPVIWVERQQGDHARESATPNRTQIPVNGAELFLGNSGTCMRFLTALVSLGHGRFRLDGSARMQERPIESLLAALRQLGAQAVTENESGCPPLILEARGLGGGTVRLSGQISSQFLSALLMVAPLAHGDVTIEIVGELVSAPYVDMTMHMVRQAGGVIDAASRSRFVIRGRQQYKCSAFDIEPDASAASYFFAAAAITGGKITVPDLGMSSLQGDVRFVEILKEMGCTVEQRGHSLIVRGGRLRALDVDMRDMSDCVMTLAAVACFAEGTTKISNVGHIRHKETDRLHALAVELGRVGIAIRESDDGLAITGGLPRGALIQTYNDHRMAMSMSLIGLRVPGIIIQDPGCVAKTYPGFFTDLEQLNL